jgi:hypothetical protein
MRGVFENKIPVPESMRLILQPSSNSRDIGFVSAWHPATISSLFSRDEVIRMHRLSTGVLLASSTALLPGQSGSTATETATKQTVGTIPVKVDRTAAKVRTRTNRKLHRESLELSESSEDEEDEVERRPEEQTAFQDALSRVCKDKEAEESGSQGTELDYEDSQDAAANSPIRPDEDELLSTPATAVEIGP